MKKQNKAAREKNVSSFASKLNWKNRRAILEHPITLEVDLENRQIFFQPGFSEKLNFDPGTTNVDSLIESYVDPKDLKQVVLSLTEAKAGQEKPILFNFIHPLTSRSFRFEYRYQIVYVKYASTRLHGELVKLKPERPEKFSSC